MEAFPVEADGARSLALRDPEGLTEDVLVVPQGLIPVLALLDGRHTVEEILAELGCAGEEAVRAKVLDAVETLRDKLFLEGPSVETARAELARAFRESPTRKAAHAGSAYDADPRALRERLDSFYKDPAGPAAAAPPDAARALKGLVAPHIDYGRGGPCYAWAYRELAARGGADLYVVLGTCHAGLRSPFAATLKDYETPLGPCETDAAFVRALERRTGLDLLSGELAHRGEHSIELQAVFLRHATPPDRPFKIVPILASYCHELLARGRRPEDCDDFRRLVDALREELARPGRAVCLVAGADLAHMGTRFGDAPLTPEQLRALEKDDRRTLEAAAAVDPKGFFDDVARDGDRRRICGYSPIHALLAVLEGQAEGALLRYGQWPDPEGAVTFAGMAFLEPRRAQRR